MINIYHKFFQNFQVYLIGLLPAGIIAGPAIIELILLTLSVNFLIDFFYIKNIKLVLSSKQKNILKTFALFCFFIIISSLFSDFKLVSLKVSVFYFRYALYAISLFYFLYKIGNNYNIKIIYIFFSITLTILIFDSLLQIFNEKNVLGQVSNTEYAQRISGLFGDKFILGSFLQKFFPIYLYILFKCKNSNVSLYDYLLIVLIFALTFRSGDRSALGLLLLYSVIFFIIQKKLRNKMIVMALSMSIVVSLLIWHNPGVYTRYVELTVKQFTGKYYDRYKKDQNQIFLFSFTHHAHYTTAINMFFDKPLIGHGPKMFRYKCDKYDIDPVSKYDAFGNVERGRGCSTHPHNYYVQLLAETGIIGFLFLLFFFFSILINLIRVFRNKEYLNNKNYILLIAMFVNFWPIIPTGNIFNNWVSILYFLPISFYLFEKNRKK